MSSIEGLRISSPHRRLYVESPPEEVTRHSVLSSQIQVRGMQSYPLAFRYAACSGELSSYIRVPGMQSYRRRFSYAACRAILLHSGARHAKQWLQTHLGTRHESYHRRLRYKAFKAIEVSDSGTRKAVNREDKRSRRYRDRDFAKFERSRRYRDR